MFCSFALLLKASECLSISGGFSEVKAADDYIQKIADEVKSRVLRRYKGRKMYKAIEFEEQVVAGTNYRIKIQVDNNEFTTIKVFKPLMNGQAKFKGFLSASRTGPILKPPKIPKLPTYKESMFFNLKNFGEDKKANKKVQSMLDQFEDEINKDLGNEGGSYKADVYRTQKAEKGMFFEISFWESEYDYSKALIFRSRDGKLEFRSAYVFMAI